MKIRLDSLLMEKKLADTLQKAKALIGAGKVLVNDHVADKAGQQVDQGVNIIVKDDLPYVSRGGIKLAAGLDFFNLSPEGFVCADIGASTGGFTDCLLQRGAAKVYAIDVGYGQLAWKLRQDERVVVLERTNARHLQPGDLPRELDFAVIDASFISLRMLVPPLLSFFSNLVSLVALIKPQFEVNRDKVSKGGVVKDTALHEKTIADITDFAGSLGLKSLGVTPSPILGPKGNREFLIYLVSDPCSANLKQL